MRGLTLRRGKSLTETLFRVAWPATRSEVEASGYRSANTMLRHWLACGLIQHAGYVGHRYAYDLTEAIRELAAQMGYPRSGLLVSAAPPEKPRTLTREEKRLGMVQETAEALEKANGSNAKAAKLLGISTPAVWWRVQRNPELGKYRQKRTQDPGLPRGGTQDPGLPRERYSLEETIAALKNSSSLAEAARKLGIVPKTLRGRIATHPDLNRYVTRGHRGQRINQGVINETIEALKSSSSIREAARKLNLSTPSLHYRIGAHPQLKQYVTFGPGGTRTREFSLDETIKALSSSSSLKESAGKLGIQPATLRIRLRNHPELETYLKRGTSKAARPPVSDDQIREALLQSLSLTEAAYILGIAVSTLSNRLKNSPELSKLAKKKRGGPKRGVDDEHIRQVLGRADTLDEAAKILGISKDWLYRRIYENLELVELAKPLKYKRPGKERGGKLTTSIPNIFSSKSEWSERELRMEGLPLYWSEAWLGREYKALGSFEAIERTCGYPASTVSAFAKKHFGWDIKPRRNEAKQAVIARWETGERSKKALAREFGVSIGSVFNWIKELEER